MPYDSFDNLLSQMVAEFDDRGLLDRVPVQFVRDELPDTTLSFPGKVVADGPSGRLFIADTNHNRIIVTSLDGTVSSRSLARERPDSTTAASRRLPSIIRRAWRLVGDVLYVADSENHALRKVDLAAGTVETIAGTGDQGYMRQGRGAGRNTELNSPWDLAYHDGKLYIAMAGMHQLWSMDLADGMVGPYAGTGRESITDGPLGTATLAQPSGITTDGERLFFADSETSSIRSAALDPSGRVQTIVGMDLFVFGDVDGADHRVRLQHPIGIANYDGTVYIADTYNHKIKRILPATRSSFTLAGYREKRATRTARAVRRFSRSRRG